jgi:hypothetical protein
MFHSTCLQRLAAPSQLSQVKVKSKSQCDWRSVGQSVLVSSPIWGPRPDFCYCQTAVVLSMRGPLSDEKTGLSSVAATVSSTWHICLQFYLSAFYSHLSRVQFLVDTYYLQFDSNPSIYVCTIYTRPQSGLGTADHALSHAAHVNDICLVTWMVVGSTATKFKPLIFSVSRFSYSNFIHSFIYIPWILTWLEDQWL